MEDVITKLSLKQKTEVPIIGDWIVKDILAHLVEWKIEQANDIEVILKGEEPWHVSIRDDEYNEKLPRKENQGLLKKCIKSGRIHLLNLFPELKN